MNMHLDKAMPELIIFDCDGVLIDSEVISANTLIGLLDTLGINIDFSYVQEHCLGRSFPTVAASLRINFGIDLPKSFEAEYRRELLKTFATTLKATNGIRPVLEQIAQRVCVATSSSPERVSQSLKITQLRPFFENHIYTASQVSRGKPAPDLFLYAAHHESIAPNQCLVIEDSEPGVDAALAAGMNVVRYLGGKHYEDTQVIVPDRHKNVSSFDSWTEFFDIFPQLRTK